MILGVTGMHVTNQAEKARPGVLFSIIVMHLVENERNLRIINKKQAYIKPFKILTDHSRGVPSLVIQGYAIGARSWGQ